MSDDIDAETWKKLKASSDEKVRALTAETDALIAQAAMLAAKKRLAAAQAPESAVQAAAANSLVEATGAKALAESRKAAAEADLGMLKARIGELPASGIKGDVELGDKAASMETALLAAQAMATAAQSASTAIKGLINGGTVLVYPSGELPDFQALTSLRTSRKLLSLEFTNSLRALQGAIGLEMPAAVPALGVALDAVSKVSSYLRSDFKVSGIELAADHAAFAGAVAGRLREDLPAIVNIHVPALYQPSFPSLSADFFSQEIDPLNNSNLEASQLLVEAELKVEELTASYQAITATTEVDVSAQKTLSAHIGAIRAAIERTRKISAAYNAWLDNLMAGKDTAMILRQYEQFKLFSQPDAYVLVAKVHHAGGSSYVEKNVWTFLGAMPFYVMGGVVVSYALLEAITGNLLASATIPVHSGFESVKNIASVMAPTA